MTDDTQDVTQEPSPAQDTAPAPVTAALPTDRPVENVVAEWNRKFGRLQEQMGTVLTMLQQQQQFAQPPAQKGPATDEELWSLAQQGDRGAFEMYQERIAERKARALMGERDRESLVDQQLNALAARYPVFNDTAHPLTQTVQSAYHLMVSRGYPQGKNTLLDAMKTAIADRPDLVADMVGRSPDAARVSATRRAQAGQTGATTRDVPASGAQRQHQVTSQQAQLARQYGVKDPGKAIERFKQRQSQGVSQLGAVGSMLTDEEIA